MNKLLSLLLIGTALIGAGCVNMHSIPAENIKIMSYNIRHGCGLDNKIDLKRTARVISGQTPDWCALQEIDNSCTRSGSVDQVSVLGKYTNMTPAFAKFMAFAGGEYGMGALSNLPVSMTEVIKLPPAQSEPRSSLLQVIILKNGLKVVIVNVHLDWSGTIEGIENRFKQAQKLVSRIDELDMPAIITGDFNTTPDSKTMKYFTEQGFTFMDKGKDNRTFQLGKKPEIDHIIYRSNSRIEITGISIDVLDEPITSDHRPVIATLEVKLK